MTGKSVVDSIRLAIVSARPGRRGRMLRFSCSTTHYWYTAGFQDMGESRKEVNGIRVDFLKELERRNFEGGMKNRVKLINLDAKNISSAHQL